LRTVCQALRNERAVSARPPISETEAVRLLLGLLAAASRRRFFFGSSDGTTESALAPGTPPRRRPPLANPWLVAGIFPAAAAWESSRGSHLIGEERGRGVEARSGGGEGGRRWRRLAGR
jgi:hypothetical protein